MQVRYGLRPLRQISAAAASINPAQPGARLSEDMLPEEVKNLVEAMNAALARLENARRGVSSARQPTRCAARDSDCSRLDAMPEMPEVASLKQDAARMARLVHRCSR